MVDVFNYYGLQLNHNNKALCPFHNDTHASLSVKPKKNIATCFSCGVTGNVISFVQKYEKQVNNVDLSYNQTLAKVVEICNLNIDVSRLNKKNYDNQYKISARKYSEEEKRLLEINKYLARLFNYNLTVIDKEPLDYLHGRNVEDKQIEELNLGYSEKGQLLKIAEKNDKIKREDLLKLGYLRYDSYGNIQESFTNRIMFPIQDEKGNIVSFAGRGIKNEEIKYLHTEETDIFKKRELLYNFVNAKPLAYNNEIIIVEGFLDVAGAKRIGFENVVATMGVALSDEHLNLIQKNHSTITLALDNDKAGHDAMIKVIPELLQKGIKVDVLDFSKIGDYKDFGNLSEKNIAFMDIQKSKVSGFRFLLDHKYFKDIEFKVENIYEIYKTLKKDKLITNTYDDALFKEYIMDYTEFNKQELDEIMYPKKIENKANVIDNLTAKAMTNFLYTELLSKISRMDDKVLSVYFNNHKETIEKRLVSLFNSNPDYYLDPSSASLNTEVLLAEFLKDNKEYNDYETLNRFKYVDIFQQTYIKNSNGSAKINLKENQIQMVIKQFEDSLSDEEKLALEEVEELYIINNESDIDGILSYNNKTLDIIKGNIKQRLFLNKNKMQFFKYGNLFLNIDKDFIDDKFKGKTGNYKTVLFFNNLDNKLNLDKSNVITNEEEQKEASTINKDIEQIKELKKDFEFSVNQVLLRPDLDTDTHYFVRIPNTGAKEYMYIPKNECDWKDSDEIFYTKLKYGETYKIYDINGKYIYDKSFYNLKSKWEDKTKKEEIPSNEIIQEVKENPTDSIVYDNNYTSKYNEIISRVYSSKIYLETEKGFYIKTDNPSTLLFVIKKNCVWTDDKSYLIVYPRKNFFGNYGISQYKLEGFKKTFEKKLSFNEITKYLKLFYPKGQKKKESLSITIPKYKCKIDSNFVEIPLTIDNISGYLNVNIVKTKIDQESVIVELSKQEQIGFRNTSGEYIDHYDGSKIYESYNNMLLENTIANSSVEESVIQEIPMIEKEAA